MVKVSPGEFCDITSEYSTTTSIDRLRFGDFCFHFWATMQFSALHITLHYLHILEHPHAPLLGKCEISGCFTHLKHRLFPNFKTNFKNIGLAIRDTFQYPGKDFTLLKIISPMDRIQHQQHRHEMGNVILSSTWTHFNWRKVWRNSVTVRQVAHGRSFKQTILQLNNDYCIFRALPTSVCSHTRNSYICTNWMVSKGINSQQLMYWLPRVMTWLHKCILFMWPPNRGIFYTKTYW
jgi:hypothetical protein